MFDSQDKFMPITDDQIIAAILAHEGSAYTNDPADAGGPTKWGITLADLQDWHRDKTITAADVQSLTVTDAQAIYRMKYLHPFDQLIGQLIRANVIDMGVNAGVQRATKMLQELVGCTVDGWIGGETIKALTPFDPDELNTMYVGFRLQYYEDLIIRKPTQIKWRNGWRNRALSYLTPISKKIPPPTLQASQSMARASNVII
jgi:lysozyme family protein